MSGGRKTPANSSLARKMAAPGGRTVAQAVREAEAGLDSHREDGMRAIAAALAKLEAGCAARDDAAQAGIYERAAELADMAGFFETGPLYKAAFSLCEASDRMTESGVWHWPSIEVHVRALRRILSDGCREDDAARMMLAGLAGVLGRLAR